MSNNTSGFNCRRAAGQANSSAHAYGEAIDINPLQNPSVRPGSIMPRGYWAASRDRQHYEAQSLRR